MQISFGAKIPVQEGAQKAAQQLAIDTKKPVALTQSPGKIPFIQTGFNLASLLKKSSKDGGKTLKSLQVADVYIPRQKSGKKRSIITAGPIDLKKPAHKLEAQARKTRVPEYKQFISFLLDFNKKAGKVLNSELDRVFGKY